MIWLLDKYIPVVNEEEGRKLCEAIKAAGDTYKLLDREDVMKPDIGSKVNPALAYGSISFDRAVNSSIYPGKWCDWESFSCERYYTHIGPFLFNQDYIMLPASEALRREEELIYRYGGAFFMRPARGDKPFSGVVLDYNEDTEKAASHLRRDVRCCEPHNLVVISPIQEIEGEWRCVMRRKYGVIASSRYKLRGEESISENMPIGAVQVAEEVADVLDRVLPDPMYTIDIAKSKTRDYSVLEINSFSCSGFYACNMTRLVSEAKDAAMCEWMEYEAGL